ncbi:MAG: helix-turn-helix domain-containing protein [Planctomycetota bacterium]|jgi:AraC-like DNA-binding protein
MSNLTMIKFLLLNINGEYLPQTRVDKPHSHPEWQFDYIAEGEVLLTTFGKPLHLKKGEAAISPPDYPHELQWLKKTRISSIHFFWDEKPDIDYCKPAYITAGTISQNLLDDFLKYGQYTDKSSINNAACYFHILLSRLFKLSKADSNRKLTLKDITLKEFEENKYQPLKIPELAEKCKLSVNHFIRKFKAETGSTPANFILQCRIARACELIRHSDANLTNIAYTLGFADLYTFSKAFKKIVGVAPSRFEE